ncbi:LysR substrate-binding domain-containing protein [Brachybacterium sp. GPGPB12]|uniref:LysR substrate-binding domain-containing protein n=1 Tax=Brachybacterium sp. GPGPB12 TaxID=3023517 RepID=UPI0031344797
MASFQTPLIALAPATVSVLERRHPDLRIEIAQREVEEAYQGSLAHRFEVILGEDYPGGQQVVRRGTDREDLLQDPLLLVLPDHGPASGARRLEDLAEMPWALDPEGTRTGAWERTYLRSAGIEPWVRFDTPDPLLQVHLVRSGHAAAFVPGLIAAEHLGGTRCRAPARRPPPRALHRGACGRSRAPLAARLPRRAARGGRRARRPPRSGPARILTAGRRMRPDGRGLARKAAASAHEPRSPTVPPHRRASPRG